MVIEIKKKDMIPYFLNLRY